MSGKTNFFIRQGIKYFNQSKLTILVLSLAVSLVAGFGYYFDSAQKYILDQGYVNVFDFQLNYNNASEKTFNFCIDSIDMEYIYEFEDSPLNIKESIFFVSIYSQYIALNRPGYPFLDIQNVPLWILSPESLYKSSRFQEFIRITSGRYPQAPNEFILESTFAANNNLTIGFNRTLSFNYGITQFNQTNVSNFQIVGTYQLNKPYVIFGKIPMFTGNNILFGYNDFLSPNLYYPTPQLIQALQIHPDFTARQNFGLDVQPSIGFISDHSTVQIAWLSRSSDQIENNFNRAILNFPNSTSASDYLVPIIRSQFKFQTTLRLSIQFTNLPLYLFAVYMGSIANKANIRKRYNEFFSMRMRGFPKKLIRNQLLFEAIFNSFFIAIGGILLGFVIFRVGQIWLNPLFLEEFIKGFTNLPLFTTSISYISSAIFAVILSLISSISSIRYINNLKTSELVTEIALIQGDVDYDESSLYVKEYKTKQTHSFNEGEIEELDIKNFIKKKEDIIPKWGIPIALSALIPLLFYSILIWGQIPTAPDNILEMAEFLKDRITIIVILTLASPFVLIIGILHFIIVESPPRFAKIIRFLSHPFVKNRDYFLGIEMVRQKQFSRIIFLSGIFIALLFFGNMSTNSLVHQSYLRENFKVGGDVNLEFILASQFFHSLTDIDRFEEQLYDARTESNQSLIQHTARAFIYESYIGQLPNFRFFINLTSYLNVFQLKDNPLPSPRFLEDLKDVIEYNRNMPLGSAGIIVSSTFLQNNGFQLGETLVVLQNFLNTTLGEWRMGQLTLKIIKVIDTMPGLYISDDPATNFIVIDDHIFGNLDDLFVSRKIREIITLDQAEFSSADTGDIESQIISSTTYLLFSNEFKFYNYQWKSAKLEYYYTLEIPYLGLIYFNLIIIGSVLAIGVSILVFSAQDENRGIYGEILARGFGKKGINKMISVQVFLCYFLAIIVGVIGGLVTAFMFCKMYGLTLGGGFIILPIFFNWSEFLIILGGILSLSFLMLGFSFIQRAKTSISRYLEKVE